MQRAIRTHVLNAHGTPEDKEKFFTRLQYGKITRNDDRYSHFCVYFAAFDPLQRLVFIGHHIKSDLWLFNGGHIEPNELPEAAVIREAQEEWGLSLAEMHLPPVALVTLTTIEHPEKQVCREHYDLWFFLPFDAASFHPSDKALHTEFFSYGWKTYDEAAKLLTSLPTKDALHYLKNIR